MTKTDERKIKKIIDDHLHKRGLTQQELKRIVGEKQSTSLPSKLNLVIKA